MGTRSNIGYVENERAKVVYCHWDGYLEHNGKLLFSHYNSLEKAKEIVALGALSFLDENLYPSSDAKHSFDERQDGVSVAYHRDRGEELEILEYEVSKSKPLEALEKLNDLHIEFVYIFYQNKWWVKYEDIKHFVLLEDALEKFDEEVS